MALFKFQTLEVWQISITLTDKLFDIADQLSASKKYRFAEQLNGAALSISNNIAEGSEYNNNRQFIRYLKYSKGSRAEVRNMLILARELQFCNQDSIQISYDVSIEISQNLSNFIKYLNNNTKD